MLRKCKKLIKNSSSKCDTAIFNVKNFGFGKEKRLHIYSSGLGLFVLETYFNLSG